MAETVDAQSQRQHAEVVAWRRHMHRHPELSFKEVDTANFLERELAAIDGIEVSRPTPTSLLARLAGGRQGRTLAMRADIDALPLQDQKSCDYASGNANVMHACGHDGHAAMLLGAARILAGLRAQVPGEVRFFFQHAEEQHPGGAQQMVDAGVMQGVDQVISAHVMSTLDTGSIAVLDGPALASSDRFVLRLRGRGGHAANPDRCIDPIMIGAQIVGNLQAVVSRNTDPHEALILSVTRFDGGSAFNVIPDAVELWGSVRCFSDQVRAGVPALVERIANGVAAAHGATCELEYIRGYSPVVNDPAVAERMRAVVRQGIATAALQPIRPLPNSEDFSAFLKHAPGAYVFVGARSAAKGIVHPHHHPHFDFDEDALLHGVQLFANAPFHLNA
ncbi:MAG: N-acyl-L-amino acid amidohydrolase [Variovorax sp. 67-131]|nr:MAG: N-acyl-L-amino acid amidohydrolase [Variovorax sp. SCN 67-85]ODV26063.1 MAG: N-acyl-L-amino acid amidohydrolase [Variovorax sp. SCN 67-20]OJZ10421.1 MAG: N-acyl-L-amino acid amidohydrolase [Variovorax sp. 67-131]